MSLEGYYNSFDRKYENFLGKNLHELPMEDIWNLPDGWIPIETQEDVDQVARGLDIKKIDSNSRARVALDNPGVVELMCREGDYKDSPDYVSTCIGPEYHQYHRIVTFTRPAVLTKSAAKTTE